MTSVRRGGSEVTEPADEEFEVTIPGLREEPAAPHPGPADHTERVPTEEWRTRSLTPMPGGDAVAAVGRRPEPASRVTRFGAALFWMAVGWWLFAAVRLADAVARSGFADGALRQVSGETLRDAARAATTTSGRTELLALVALSVLAAVVLLVSRRRALGLLAFGLAAAAAGVAGWQLLS
ncbi:hypothetical protein [Intrasporangium calvum]|uniref:hypothetical protein n=1 Tax=Intrasporangium calvum TaxID=53358 RepID=UPI000DF60D6D|nr:hypothetical protein [Intrasporangium calvum]AXG15018.1 hypothetical protein DN585_17805 [Intrasporangium calvum]